MDVYSDVSLPPQTTPFTPPKTCSSIVVCTHSSTKGCHLVDAIVQGRYVGYIEACHPPGYLTLNNAYQYGVSGVESDTLLLALDISWRTEDAYPGTACPSGWSSACDTKILRGTPKALSDFLSRTLCCPNGYNCADAENACERTLSGPDEIFYTATYFPITTGTVADNDYRYVLAEESDLRTSSEDSPPVAFIFAVPLEATSTSDAPRSTSDAPRSTSRMVSQSQGTTTSTAIATVDDKGHGISVGSIAGIAIGATAFVLALIGVAAYFFWRRRRNTESHPSDGAVVEDYGFDGKRELPGNALAEMEHVQKHAEVAGNPILELELRQ